jgi:hypothetical protein
MKELLNQVENHFCYGKKSELPSDFLYIIKYVNRAARLHEILEHSIEHGSRGAISQINGYLSNEIQNVKTYCDNIKAWFERVKAQEKKSA